MKRTLPILFSCFLVTCSCITAFAQKDTLQGALEETIVTATRTEKKISNVAVPVTIISQKIIQQSGSLRLNDILQEQTGLFVTGGSGSNAVGGGIFGNGIQLQGLAPDYTMILLDGEPLIGRQGGVMDISRFTVGNIKKIEVVKGPSSSLYGSEAMGGVVNIITDPLINNQAQIGVRYGSFNTSDVLLSGQTNTGKLTTYYFLNRNESNGYDLDKSTPEKSIDPYYSYTGQLKFTYRFSPKTSLILNNRYYYNWQNSYYAINNPSLNIGGGASTKDFTINPVLLHQFTPKIKNRFSLVASGYSYNQRLDSLKNGAVYYQDFFTQHFYRIENIVDFTLGKHLLTTGAGYTLQTVNTSRYKEKKYQQVYHAFLQDEWKIKEKLTLIAGVRYDNNTDFKSRLSPKIAAKFKVSNKVSISSSFGYGFKAPDFRQLYLNFVNQAGDGYSLFGANEFSIAELSRQQNLGLVAQILPAAYTIKELKPEISQGFNFGIQLKPISKLAVDINVFKNDIDNLINYIPVATNTNNTSVFSYVNISRAFTQGIELNFQYKLNNSISIATGYQFLETADKDILTAVKNKQVFGRDEQTNIARLMTLKDYGGLQNRSKHIANFRFFYDNVKSGWQYSIRIIYRGKWGVIDKDGNGFSNRNDEYAPELVQVNTTLTKKIKETLTAQIGVNNLLNNTNARYLANIAPTNFYTSINYTIKYKK